MTSKEVPIAQIKQLAEDIRLIKDFAENHNFDPTLISAAVTPITKRPRQLDWPLISIALFAILLLGAIAALNFMEPVSAGGTKFIFALALLTIVGAAVAAHRKFDNTTITLVTSAGLLAVLLIGGGVFTPKEAVDQVQKFQQTKK
jgi:uncharacterized membrane protein